MSGGKRARNKSLDRKLLMLVGLVGLIALLVATDYLDLGVAVICVGIVFGIGLLVTERV